MTRSSTDWSAGHQHDRHCYWDHMECAWMCGPPPQAQVAAEAPAASSAPAQAPATPLAAGGPAQLDPLTDSAGRGRL